MINKARGEYAFEFGGKTYTLVASLGATARIEAMFGKPFARMAMEMADGIGIEDSFKILTEFAKAGGHEGEPFADYENEVCSIAKLALAITGTIEAAMDADTESGNA